MTDSLTKAFKVLAIAVICITMHAGAALAASSGSELEQKPVSLWDAHHGNGASLIWHAPEGNENELPQSPEPPPAEDLSDAPDDESAQGEGKAELFWTYHRRAADESARRLLNAVSSIGPARAPPRA